VVKLTISQALSIINWALLTDGLVSTGGRHVMYVSMPALSKYIRVGFYSQLILVWVMTWIKVSVALLFLRIEQSKSWRIGIWSLIGVVFSVAIAATIYQLLQCRPISANWDILGQNKDCWKPDQLKNIIYAVSGLHASYPSATTLATTDLL
jgi:hypothetical protein